MEKTQNGFLTQTILPSGSFAIHQTNLHWLDEVYLVKELD